MSDKFADINIDIFKAVLKKIALLYILVRRLWHLFEHVPRWWGRGDGGLKASWNYRGIAQNIKWFYIGKRLSAFLAFIFLYHFCWLEPKQNVKLPVKVLLIKYGNHFIRGTRYIKAFNHPVLCLTYSQAAFNGLVASSYHFIRTMPIDPAISYVVCSLRRFMTQ